MNRDDFWWMGMIRKDVCNWTPWILSNVIDTLLLLERDIRRRREGVTRALRMLDSYLAVLPADGECDEGAGYFNMAGAALFDALESVYQATGGRVSFYDEPLIRRIAAFPMHVHIAGDYFVNFADCDAKPKLDGQRIALFGRRTHQPELERFGLWLAGRRTSVRPVDTPQMSGVLQGLFALGAQAEEPKGAPFAALPDLQVFAWRRGGLYAAVKGGHNGESHNHNDVGSFIVYLDGEHIACGHGEWPFGSWGIGVRTDARLTFDFGREVEIDALTLYLRADFPHDAYWISGTVTLDDGYEKTFPLAGIDGPQRVELGAHRTRTLTLDRLIKCDNPSAFPALRQIEVYGRRGADARRAAKSHPAKARPLFHVRRFADDEVIFVVTQDSVLPHEGQLVGQGAALNVEIVRQLLTVIGNVKGVAAASLDAFRKVG